MAFSLGGIVSRYYIQRLGGDEAVERFVTISSPNQGTWTAYGRDNPGTREMRVGSPFLNDLNRDLGALQRIKTTILWTPFDLMIVPAWSSKLPGIQDRSIPVLLHPWMMRDDRVLDEVVKALED